MGKEDGWTAAECSAIIGKCSSAAGQRFAGMANRFRTIWECLEVTEKCASSFRNSIAERTCLGNSIARTRELAEWLPNSTHPPRNRISQTIPFRNGVAERGRDEGAKKPARMAGEIAGEKRTKGRGCLLRRCGVAALRRCGVAALRRCGVAALRRCGVALHYGRAAFH